MSKNWKCDYYRCERISCGVRTYQRQHQSNKDDMMNKNIIDTVWDDIGDLET